MALTDLDGLLDDLPTRWTHAVVELTLYAGPDPKLGPAPASTETVRAVSERLAQRGVTVQASPAPGHLRIVIARESDDGRHAQDALLALDRVRGDVQVIDTATPTRPALMTPVG